MTIVATLSAIATVTGTPAATVEALAHTAPDPVVVTTDAVTADADYDGSLVAAAIPGNGHQIVSLRVTVGGVELPISRILPGASISRARGERATFTLPMLLRSDWPTAYAYPIGRPEVYMGPPPGGDSITIEGLYATPSGLHAVPLVTDGISDNSEEAWSALDTFTVSGLGPGGRYDRAKVTLSLPPGHGTARAALLKQVATAAEVTDAAFTSPGRVDKELREDDAEALPLLAAMMLPAGRVPNWTPEGSLTDPERVRKSGRFDFVITERGVLRDGGARRTAHADGPTKITVTGTRQITRDGCGLRTEIQWVENHQAAFAPVEAAFQQEANGDLTARTPTQSPGFELVERITTLRTFDCDRLVEDRVITQGWHNPSMWRYELDGGVGGTGLAPPKAHSTCWIVDPEAVAGDGALGYRWPFQRFVTLSDIVTEHTYDDDGYEVGRTQTSRGWHQRSAPVKEQPPTPTPWQEVDWIDGQAVLGNGHGVADRFETYFGVYYPVVRNAATNGQIQVGSGTTYVVGSVGKQRDDVTIKVDGGFELETLTESMGWGKRIGFGGYLYGEDVESPESVESFRFTGSVQQTHQPDGETSHSTITTRRDADGRLVDGEPKAVTIESGLDGYLPPAELAAGLDPGTADGLPASRSESQPITYTLEVPGPPGRPANEITVSSPWAENEAELDRIARDEAAERWPFKVTATMPVCWLMRETSRVLLRIRRRGGGSLVAEVDVKRVSHSVSERGSMWVTTWEGDQYVV